MERNEVITARIRAGEMPQTVADSYSLSRERIRQIAGENIVIGWKYRKLVKLEYSEWLKLDRLAYILSLGLKCLICDGPVLKLHHGTNRTCSRKCSNRFRAHATKVRWAKSEEFRVKHRLRTARWIWRNRSRSDLKPSAVRLAAKRLGFKGPAYERPLAAIPATKRWAKWRAEHPEKA